MSWGQARRPKIEYGKATFPNPREGSDGDIQVRQTNLGAKLFGKVGGAWYGTPLTVTAGDPVTRVGVNLSDHLSIDRNSIDIFSNSVKVASFGETTTVKDINLTGKIGITSASSQNVLIGSWASTDPDVGDDCVAIGTEAGKSMTSDAEDNVYIGTEAGTSATSDLRNIAIGYRAGFNMAGATYGSNVMLGYYAGNGVGDGDYNVFIGSSAGYGATGGGDEAEYNVGIGASALNQITDGTDNTALGRMAGFNILGGTHNVCMGQLAGYNLTSGLHNTLLGSNARTSAADSDYQIVIGSTATGQGDSYAVIGNASVTRLYAAQDGAAVLYANATIVSSDERMKENIEDINIGLDFINKLTPITFTRKQPADYEQSLKEKLSWYGKSDPRVIEDTQKAKIRPGFLAQDIEDVLKELNFSENNSIIQVDDATTQYSMDYASMVVPLTKAVQELSAKLDTMQTEINNLKAE